MKGKICLSALVATALLSIQAAPSISVGRVQQRYPWNGLVDVDYTIAGADEPYCLSLAMTMTADGTDHAMQTFLNGTPPVSNGTYRATWNAAADGVSSVCSNATFTVVLNENPSVVAYLVIDVSGGSAATSYPATIETNVADPASRYSAPEFKSTHIVLRRCPPGTFWMGAVDGDTDAADEEKPRHFVKLTQGFFMGIFPVTRRQYQYVMGGTIDEAKADYPVVSIAANDLINPAHYPSYASNDGFMIRLRNRVVLSGTSSDGFSLPTEAQWEYACRAGTTGIRFCADADMPQYIQYNEKHSAAGVTMTSVGSKLANPWGIYDMLGNAGELVEDRKGTYPATDETNPDVNPLNLTGGNWSHCGRGGNWSCYAEEMRCSKRYGATGNSPNGNTGFRLAFNLPTAAAAADPEPSVVTNVAVDLTAGVLTPTSVDLLFPFAYNNTADWRVGGDPSSDAALIEVEQMSGSDPTDPTGWTPVGAKVVLSTLPGESKVSWMPSAKSLYRARLTVGLTTADAYFNTTATGGIKPSVAEMEISLSATEVDYTTYPVHPVVTVSEKGGKTLVENQDYTLSYSDDVHVGTCVITIRGVGDYGGEAYARYDIVYPSVATSEAARGDFDLRTDNPLVVSLPEQRVPWAWNSTAAWIPGGDANAIGVTYIPLAGPDAEPDEALRQTLFTRTGEGAMKIREPDGWCLVEMGAFSRRVRFCRKGLMLLVK